MTDSEKLDLLIVKVGTIETDVSGLKEDVSELKTDVSSLKEDVSELKTDVSGLKEDVSELKEDVSGLKTDVANLKEDVSGLKEKVGGLETDVGSLKTNFNNFRLQMLKSTAELKTMDDMILDEIERVHAILDKHISDKSLHTA